MQRHRSRLIAGALALALAAPLVGAASPAGAVPSGNGCNNTTGILGATISWYPANPAGMSSLKVSCTFNNQPAGPPQVSPSFTVHDHNAANWHNGAARTLTTTGTGGSSVNVPINMAVTGGLDGLPAAGAVYNRMVSGAGIPVRTHVVNRVGNTLVFNRPVNLAANATFKIENGNGRSFTNATYTAPDKVNSAAGTGAATFDATTDVGLSISGTGIAANSTISVVNSATQVTVTPAFAGLGGGTVSIGGTQLVTTARQITGATTPSAARINSTAAGWAASDLGLRVQGRCYNGAGADTVFTARYITNIASALNADVTPGGLPVQSECDLTVGESNATAPADGDVVAHQGVQLDLAPGFVAGSGDCADEQPEGFATIAKWYNPGNFQQQNPLPGLTNLQPTPTKAIGQILYDTSVADFSAFVIERKAATAGDPIGVVHYDIVTPFAPTSLAMCPGTATSPGLGFSVTFFAAAASQTTAPTGTGRPGTGQIRNTLPSLTGGYNSTAYVRSDDPGVTFAPASAFQRLCAYPAGTPNAVDFFCGNG
jgi:hypothetical protein